MTAHTSPTRPTQAGLPVSLALPANAAAQNGPGREFLAWARAHQRDQRHHAAELAQITRHHDPGAEASAVHQLQAWALRQAHHQHLHDSAIAALRHH